MGSEMCIRDRCRASGWAAPAVTAEAHACLGEETEREGFRRRERFAKEKKCQVSQKTATGIFSSKEAGMYAAVMDIDR